MSNEKQKYRVEWDLWQSTEAGSRVVEMEQRFLSTLLADTYGKYALLIGTPFQHTLLEFNPIQNRLLISPIKPIDLSIKFIQSDLTTLPIASKSADLVLLPHILEYTSDPFNLFQEACRVLKPEGHIIILGFNPYSLWGIAKKWSKEKTPPWAGEFIAAHTIKRWLWEADYQVVRQNHFLFSFPDIKGSGSPSRWIEWIGSKLWAPFGGVYLLMAKASMIPLTPIKVNWKEEPRGIRVPLPGGSIRNGSS